MSDLDLHAPFREGELDITPQQNSPNGIPVLPSNPSIASPLPHFQSTRRSPRLAKNKAQGKPEVLKQIFTYLNKQTKHTLRGIAKSRGKRIGGTKKVLVYRLYRFLFLVQENNGDPIEKLDQNEQCPSFALFEKHHNECDEIWQAPPDAAEIATVLGSVELSEDLGNGSSGVVISPHAIQNTSPFFSISEFARLVLILRDYHARKPQFKHVDEINRAQLDVAHNRQGFWGAIANLFNNHSIAPHFSFIGPLEGVDAAAPPPVPRPGTSLKQHFWDARSIFNKAVERWSRSGQNDPCRFTDFLSQNGRVSYASCKRALVLFVVSKMGSANADTSFIEMSNARIDVGGYEEGVYFASEPDAKRSGPRDRAGGIDKVSTTSHNHLSEASKKRFIQLQEWTDNDSMFLILEKALRSFVNAQLDTEDTLFLELAERRYKRALRDFERMEDEDNQ